MADISYTTRAVEKRASPGIIPGKGDANNVRCLFTSVIEQVASASGATIYFGRIPSNARISAHLSRVYWDDLATSGSPTLDLGLASVDANITSDPDALSDGHVVTSADLSGEPVVALFASSGKFAWEFVSGQSVDPKGSLDVYGTIKDAATTQTGTILVELYGYLD